MKQSLLLLLPVIVGASLLGAGQADAEEAEEKVVGQEAALLSTAMHPGGCVAEPETHRFPKHRFVTSAPNVQDMWPCYSPDSRTLLFTRTTDRKTWNLFTVAVDGGTATPFPAQSPASGTRANWSPRHNRIAFNGRPPKGQFNLSLVDGDGTGLRVLESAAITDQMSYPSWYPDGKSVAVVEFMGAEGSAIRKIDIEQGTAITLTDPRTHWAGVPRVSPDGNTIVMGGQLKQGQPYSQYKNQIWILSRDGKLRPLDSQRGWAPAWSPDGKWIVFASDRGSEDGQRAIFLASPDGETVRQLTPSELNAGHPTWSPDGKWIAFFAQHSADKEAKGLAVIQADAALALAGITSSAGTARAQGEEGASAFPVRASSNSRYLEDARGKPFLLHGDTAWSVMVQLTKDETEEYLENRRQKGFNAILANLIEYYYADNPPKNRYGDEPFHTLGDFATPNERYFAHADWLIQKAAGKEILVVLNPCYTGFSTNYRTSRDGWIQAILANGPEKCRDFGRYLGRRYKSQTNIIWQAGGDTTIPVGSDLEKNWLEMLLGIQEQAPGHHWTAHWRRFTTAVDQPTFAPYMTLDNAYGGNRTYIQTLRAYNRAKPKPTFVNEGYYEDTRLGIPGVATAQQMRAQAYWAILSGATGHIFGCDHLWMFGGPRGTPGNPWPRLDWRAGMDRPSSQEMVHVQRLFGRFPWHQLVPDQDHSVVTAGVGTYGEDDRTPAGDYVTAARSGDGSLVMAYVPSTGTRARTITVDLSRLGAAAEASWYNPTNGEYTRIVGSPLANDGPREFVTPGDNGTGTGDWVLILEAEIHATRKTKP